MKYYNIDVRGYGHHWQYQTFAKSNTEALSKCLEYLKNQMEKPLSEFKSFNINIAERIG